jgi:lipoprotein Spr
MRILFTILLFCLVYTCQSQTIILENSIDSFYQDWKNVPYRFGGNSKKGIDCSKFTRQFYLQVYDTLIPPTCRTQYEQGEVVDSNKLTVGDLVYFSSKVSPSGWHCGIYVGNDLFLHASNYKDGIKISCIFDPMYQRLLKGYRRFKK